MNDVRWAKICWGRTFVAWVPIADDTMEAKMLAFDKWLKDNKIKRRIGYNISDQYPPHSMHNLAR